MDARLDPAKILGLEEGDAHVIRNAGGVATEDAIRSLTISQRLLGTEEIVLLHHTDCGMVTFSDDGFRQDIEEETGIRPSWSAEAFTDPAADVRQSVTGSRRRRSSPGPTGCGASCSTSRPAGSTRSEPQRRLGVRRQGASSGRVRRRS